jgi:hypothetical protein
MPSYSGKFQYSNERATTLAQGACQLSFDQDTCIVTPASGAPIAFDLGDVDCAGASDWELQLKLYTGHVVALRQFGRAFERMSQELTAAWRDRTVRCLLLEDLEEAGRYNATVALGPAAEVRYRDWKQQERVPPASAEIRIYKSNIAVLPSVGVPLQWRLADVDAIAFDDGAYAVHIESGNERLTISKLARKTDECFIKLREQLAALRQHSAEAMHKAFPFLNAVQLQRLLAAMPEGRSAKLAALAPIHPKLVSALLARAVDPRLKPYFDALRSRAVEDALMAGYKFVCAGEAEDDAEGEGGEESAAGEEAAPSEPAAPDDANPLFFWFLLPMAAKEGHGYANVVAWEASTGSGRATYFFRAVPPDRAPTADLIETAAMHLTRGLALVNFRREPVYLSDDSLDRQQRFHRYAIGARKLPELRALRAAFLGRAIHSSLDQWSAGVAAIAGQ